MTQAMNEELLSLEELKERSREYDKLLALIESLKEPTDLEAVGPSQINWASVPKIDRVQRMCTATVMVAINVLRTEIEFSPPDKRNRFTVSLFYGEESWNLTLARGDYSHAMEKQRDLARKERDFWMTKYYEEHPEEPQVHTNDHEDDGS